MGRSKRLPKYLNESEAQSLLDAPGAHEFRDRLVLALMLNMGMRVSEVCALTIENINWREEQLLVFAGKGDRDRYLLIPKSVIGHLHNTLGNRKHGYVILPKQGSGIGPMTSRQIQRMVKQWAVRAGIGQNVTPHILRHTYAVWSWKRDQKMRTIQETLGHSRLDTTEIYLQITDEDAREDLKANPLPYG